MGLSPVDRLTFEPSTDREVTGRLRFQVVVDDPVAVRPWVDFVLVPVERDYLRILGAEPPEIGTITVSVAVGRLRGTGIHLPTHAASGKVEEAIDLHLEAFADILARATPEYLIDDLLRQRRFRSGRHFDWRLPIALARYGRSAEAGQVLGNLLAGVRAPDGRAAHELRWLSRRLGVPNDRDTRHPSQDPTIK